MVSRTSYSGVMAYNSTGYIVQGKEYNTSICILAYSSICQYWLRCLRNYRSMSSSLPSSQVVKRMFVLKLSKKHLLRFVKNEHKINVFVHKWAHSSEFVVDTNDPLTSNNKLFSYMYLIFYSISFTHLQFRPLYRHLLGLLSTLLMPNIIVVRSHMRKDLYLQVLLYLGVEVGFM